MLDWLPAFPPVSISIGIKLTRIGITAKAASYRAKIPPVIMLLTISTSSHKILFFASSKTPVFKYGFSLGCMAAIFWKSSVASSSSTSTISSMVTIPTSRFSLSTTGRERRSYFKNRSATASRSSVVTALITLPSIIWPRTAS